MLDCIFLSAAAAADLTPLSVWKEYKLIGEALGAWLAIPGAIIAAIWVYYRFRNTETNMAKLEYEQAKQKLGQLASPSYLNGTIEHNIIEEDGHRVIMGAVNGKNIGQMNLSLNFTATDPIIISHLKPDQDGIL